MGRGWLVQCISLQSGAFAKCVAKGSHAFSKYWLARPLQDETQVPLFQRLWQHGTGIASAV